LPHIYGTRSAKVENRWQALQSGMSLRLEEFRAPRFTLDGDKKDFLNYLEEHGYAVVANAAKKEDIEKAQSLLWDFLEALPGTKVRRSDVTTWDNKVDWLPNPSNGIIHGFGFGQSDFMWHLRQLPKVKESFAAIWGTEDLLVSFDGGNIFRPWRYNPEWLTTGGWFHCDQNARLGPESQGRVCIQGLVTLRDANGSTGGLVVVPGSHREHQHLCQRSILARNNGDFVPVAVDDPILEGAVLLAADAGDLILWDSRTVHCNTPALTALEADDLKDLNHSDWQPIREVGYVCMTPRSFASSHILKKRREAFEQNISTSHWPHKFVVAGFGLPGMPPKDPLSISQEQRWLIGYDRPRYCCVQ